ncbi:acyl-CoA dehydrogenase family protein [Nakamurella lactea]|uniref:acyl-CoA dehydrogenase family protein n=1 Tax=Nakamurella lactea TaxID=459515 RepID=UPI000427A5AB|nr:acyl-CoA dehydrogenase family protein [Nakamurella lactea]
MPPTHQVTNQVPPLIGHNATSADPALLAGLGAVGVGIDGSLTELGAAAGSAELQQAARLANEYPPRLRTHDGTGHRIDEVEYHPAWHTLMTAAVGAGLHAAPWAPGAGAHPHLRRAAGFYLWNFTEAGHLCPISMTYAVIPALRHAPALAARYEPSLQARSYDFGLRPPADKAGLLAGMSMTEKQGGSDVQANTTTAVPDSGADDAGAAGYRLTGHKWFTSAPMNDLFLSLARTPAGLSCFLLPRVLPDGSRNAIALQRLKDKLGNRSNASAEIEYDGAFGWLVGDEGRGVPTIIEMVTMTRLDCVLGSAGQLRAAVTHAAHHAAHRSAFGRPLIDQPAMTAVLADLAVESWAATLTGLRLAQAVDAGERDLLRLALPVSKFWVCKRAVPAIAEALECLGGNGYVEESVLPRLFRESPLNGLWEGSGNVTALDALRAVGRSPAAVAALRDELAGAAGVNPLFDADLRRLESALADPAPATARRIASLTAKLLAGSLLIKLAPAAVADLYCATRLGDAGDRVFGDLPAGYPLAEIASAVTPAPR